MKSSFEKLTIREGESFRCFNRRTLKTRVKWHHHPEIELTYVERGSGSRLVGDHIGSYGDNDLVLLGSELPHTWLSDTFRGQQYDRHPALVIQFHPDFLGRDFFAVPEFAAVAEMLKKAGRGLWFPPAAAEEIGGRMGAMLDQSPAARLIALLDLLQELSQAIGEAQALASTSYQLADTGGERSRIRKVCDFVEKNLADADLGHGQLAKLACMNSAAFSRFFKQTTGRTVTRYISEMRIGLACRLLVETDESILAISIQSGFSSLSNFNRRFRDLREMTPRDFRLMHRSIAD